MNNLFNPFFPEESATPVRGGLPGSGYKDPAQEQLEGGRSMLAAVGVSQRLFGSHAGVVLPPAMPGTGGLQEGGLDPNDMSQLEIVIDPHLGGARLNLGKLQPEQAAKAMAMGRDLAARAGGSGIARHRLGNSMGLNLLAEAQLRESLGEQPEMSIGVQTSAPVPAPVPQPPRRTVATPSSGFVAPSPFAPATQPQRQPQPQPVAAPVPQPVVAVAPQPQPAALQSVVFDLPGFGINEAYYSEVVVAEGSLILAVSDQPGVPKYFPPATDAPFTVHIPNLNRTFRVYSTGINYRLHGFTQCVLTIEGEVGNGQTG